ncbi:MAG: T9SS type A sorting domain-containing protein [Bacteroidetes bacterium]|nr:T9SS type A sorting domain-containing protein [Bacteroidota bacterium]
MKFRFICYCAAALLFFAQNLVSQTGNSPSTPITNSNWVATDAIGREIPSYNSTGNSRQNKTVGVFYYIWHSGSEIVDVTKALQANPSNPTFGNHYAFHHWGEPEAGYYRADDPWVIRRNMQMLVNAGVDFIFFDVTNSLTYLTTVDSVCTVIAQMRSQGIPAPYVCFTTNSGSGKTMNYLYDNFYSKNKFKSLWFYWQGKPLIMGKIEDVELRTDVKSFFTIKYSWAWTNPSKENSWQWLDTYPQDYGWTNGNPSVAEQITVTTASHPTNNVGKSFNGTTQPATDAYGVTSVTNQGIYFAKQWDRALQVDPQLIMITQWNEWMAQRFICSATDGCQSMLGKPTVEGQSWFVDTYNREYNRDIEPMKGGWSDNYYYQMLSNIRKYKGMQTPALSSAPQKISVDGNFAEWSVVSPVFKDPIGDVQHRNHPRFDSKQNYVNTSGRNDIIESRTTLDANNVYFYIKTAANITPYTNANWMLLYLNTDKLKASGWEGFDFVLNMGVTSANQTTVKKRSGSSWTTVGSATYKVIGNQMEIAVPRSLLGFTSSNVSYYYQIFDNPKALDNIDDTFVNGDAAPDRRFNFSYTNTTTYASVSVITPYTQINGAPWQTTNTATLCAGGSVIFGPHPNVESGWSWTGPNGFTAPTRAIAFANIQSNKAGNYIATYTDAYGKKSTQQFTITINPLPAATISSNTSTTFNQGGSVILIASAGSSYKWYNGSTLLGTAATYTATSAGNYTVEITNNAGCKATSLPTTVAVNATPVSNCTNLSLSESNWVIRNDWSDWNTGSKVSNENNYLKISHRIWGQNYFWIISTSTYDLNAGASYTFNFDILGSYGINATSLALASGYSWNGPIKVQEVAVAGGYTLNNFNSKSVTITPTASGKYNLAIQVKLINQPMAASTYYLKNMQYCALGSFRSDENVATQQESTLDVYPNPSQLFVTIFSEQKSQVKIVNMNGQTVWEGEIFGHKTIPTESWSSGIYQIVFITNDAVSVKRLIKE